MALDQRQLRVFLAVIDYGSLGRASAGVNMSQPAASRVLAEMEHRLGQRLFERHTRGMILTAAGETLEPHARLLMFEIGQAHAALDDLRGLRRGTVRIGAVATIARGILPAAVRALLAEAPDVRVVLAELPDDQLVTALHQREVDLIISAAPPPLPDLTTLGECRYDAADHVFAAFCAADHPLAAVVTPTLSALLAERWVMPSVGAAPRESFDRLIAAITPGATPQVWWRRRHWMRW